RYRWRYLRERSVEAFIHSLPWPALQRSFTGRPSGDLAVAYSIRPERGQFWRRRLMPGVRKLGAEASKTTNEWVRSTQMIRLTNAQVWVRDQEEALAFYTKKIGWEVRSDITMPEMGDFRWLAVGPAAQPDISVVLMAIPGPPVMDAHTAEQVRELMAKGFTGTL